MQQSSKIKASNYSPILRINISGMLSFSLAGKTTKIQNFIGGGTKI